MSFAEFAKVITESEGSNNKEGKFLEIGAADGNESEELAEKSWIFASSFRETDSLIVPRWKPGDDPSHCCLLDVTGQRHRLGATNGVVNVNE